ncbi:1-phosphatidylinositol 3-phosphate 5-kinase, partial [Hyalella azteca]|uniref:1-phosphatidylinositol 3-phosphate 5-kinase n=1 Tax=Hyalella azteca TaxID=294128 RepID=A0A8B7P4X3_HYAAZ
MQEADNVRAVVMRIASFRPRPHVVLLEGSLTHACVHKLQASGLTVVLCVKRRLLEAVARATQAEIITDLTTCNQGQVLGLCHKFDCRTYDVTSSSKTDLQYFRESKKGGSRSSFLSHENKENLDLSSPASPGDGPLVDKAATTVKKHLMFFTGCPAHLGCTVLLRGGTMAELRRVKKVVQFMVFVLYNWKLERSYLLQERALVSSQCFSGFGNMDSTEDFDIVHLDNGEGNEADREGNKGTPSAIYAGIPKSNEADAGREDHDEALPTIKPEKIETPAEVAPDNKDMKSCSHVGGRSSVPQSPSPLAEVIHDCSDPLRSEVVPRSRTLSVVVVDEVSFDDVLKNAFKKALNEMVICTSPYIRKPVPFWETEAGQASPLRKFFPKTLYYSIHLNSTQGKRRTGLNIPASNACNISEQKPTGDQLETTRRIVVREQHPFVTSSMWGDSFIRGVAYADYRACGGQLRVAPAHQNVLNKLGSSADERAAYGNATESAYLGGHIVDADEPDEELVFVLDEDLYRDEDDVALKPWKWEALGGRRRPSGHPAPSPREQGEGAASGPAVRLSSVTWSFSLAKYLEVWFYGGGVATAAPHNYHEQRYSDKPHPNTNTTEPSANLPPGDSLIPSSVSCNPGAENMGGANAGRHAAPSAGHGGERSPCKGDQNPCFGSSEGKGMGGSGLFSSDCPHPLHRPHHRQFFYNNQRLVKVS